MRRSQSWIWVRSVTVRYTAQPKNRIIPSAVAPNITFVRKCAPMMLSSGRSVSMRQSTCQWELSRNGSRRLLIGGGREVCDHAQRLEPGWSQGCGIGDLQANCRQPHREIGGKQFQV